MSPRNTIEGAAATRDAIVAEAVDRSSVEGLEGITIGKLASSLRMSKAGVIGHFGNKEALQIAALEGAVAIFRREVWEPAARKPAGIERLRALTDTWMSYLRRDVFPGGCYLTAASAEFDGRPGPVHDAIEETMTLWDRVLTAEAARAIEDGDLPADTDPSQIAFEMNAIAMGVNQARQLRGDRRATARGKRAMARILGS